MHDAALLLALRHTGAGPHHRPTSATVHEFSSDALRVYIARISKNPAPSCTHERLPLLTLPLQRLREAVASFGTSPAILRKRRRVIGATPGSVSAAAAASGADGPAGSALKEPNSVGGPTFDDLLCSPSPQSPGVALQGKQLLSMLDSAGGADAALTPSAGAFTPLPTGGAAPTESVTAHLTSTGTDVRLSLAGSVGGGAGSIKHPTHRVLAGKIVPMDLDGLLSPGRGLDGASAAQASRNWRAQNNRVSGFFQRRLPGGKMGLEFDRVASASNPALDAGNAGSALPEEPDVLAVMRAVEDSNAPLYARAEELRKLGGPAGGACSPAPLREHNVLLDGGKGGASLPGGDCGGVQMTPQAGNRIFSGLPGFSPFAIGGPSPLDAADTPGDHLRIAGELGLTDGTPTWTMRMCR